MSGNGVPVAANGALLLTALPTRWLSAAPCRASIADSSSMPLRLGAWPDMTFVAV